MKQKPFRRRGEPVGSRTLSKKVSESTLDIQKPGIRDMRILIISGTEEVGKNMYALEYNDQIVVLDCGISFSDPAYPGISTVLPNTKYLEDRKDKIVALAISHGHLDHIGGIGILIEKLGHPPIYSQKLTLALIKKRQEEYPHVKSPIYREVQVEDEVKLTDEIGLRFFGVSHTIPDAMGVLVDTPVGTLAFTGDIRMTNKDGVPLEKEVKAYKQFEKRPPLVALGDSTNAPMPGFSIPEAQVIENINNIIKNAHGRVILGAFASQIERNVEIINHAVSVGRKIVVEGRSMLANLTIAVELGLLKIPAKDIISSDRAGEYPKDKLLVLSTGAQGEEYAALNRMSNKVHRNIQIDKDDTNHIFFLGYSRK